MQANKKNLGFTLMELLIAVAIMGIISAIAYPSYQSYILKSRRAEAHVGLVKMQLQQEAHRMLNLTYASAFGNGSNDVNPPSSDYYTFTMEGATASAYLLKATAKSSQSSDSDCSPMTMNQLGVKSPAACW